MPSPACSCVRMCTTCQWLICTSTALGQLNVKSSESEPPGPSVPLMGSIVSHPLDGKLLSSSTSHETGLSPVLVNTRRVTASSIVSV